MQISPMIRYYVRRLLAEHPAILSYGGCDRSPNKIDEEELERHINLDHFTYPQLNQLEFLIQLHQKIKANEPHQTYQLQHIEKRIFDLLGLHLRVSQDAITELLSFFEQLASTDNKRPVPAANQEATTLPEYYELFQRITETAVRYLGKMIVTNYWLLTRPRDSSLAPIQVEQFHNRNFLPPERLLTNQEAKTLKQWIHNFIQHCSRVLPTFPHLLLEVGIPSYLLYDLVH
ncbi:MAG: hypothetical protein KatS3mg067_2002 [Thermosynechococcus sp.]|uniref:hypothetical protein n=1 Tax=Thermosynechococcus sp. TaxID=2814275 RepID=UPI00220E72F4|nr:hypothetical protein [Thermosynechococcus sp.]BCX13064.1 MAG: hypothetical protein KatS3mg067_2002 [Thermosynechococcus sp.]